MKNKQINKIRSVFRLFSVLLFTSASLAIYAQSGTIDNNFNIGSGFNGIVRSIAVQPDGKIVVGGSFLFYNGVSRRCLARLNEDGTLDTSFDIGTGFQSGEVHFIKIQENDKILVGGTFASFNGLPKSWILRLNEDGSLDSTFNLTGTGINGGVFNILTNNDKIIIGGSFNNFNGESKRNVLRLNNNGTLDNSFGNDFNFNTNNIVTSSSLLSNGKIIVGGFFRFLNQNFDKGIARLNANGTYDSSFSNFTATNNLVWSTHELSDGKILIGGAFTTFNNTTSNRIARLNSDGTFDDSFNIGSGFDWVVYNMALQPDGKIIVCGDFTSFNGTSVNRLVRLNANGTLDTTFTIGSGFNQTVYDAAVQNDGKILVGGDFTTFNTVNRNRIIRLNGDSNLDLDLFENHYLKIYPNPTSNYFTIVTVSEVAVECYSSLGQKQNIKPMNENQYDLSHLSNGVYLIKIKDQNSNIITTKKIIKN
ncbi:MAG: T9SS type A sorting domain-containing protein [Flavobacterium sp.]